MDKIINKAENISLTGDDILRICDDKVKIMSYDELANYDNIEDVLKPHGAVIFLYLTKKAYGHWCAIIEHDDNILEFFDPYGIPPDHQLNWNDDEVNERLGVWEPYLTNLIENSDYDLIYNNEKLQSYDESNDTCGRWCAMRVVLRNYDLPYFRHLFLDNKHYEPSFWISALTMFI